MGLFHINLLLISRKGTASSLKYVQDTRLYLSFSLFPSSFFRLSSLFCLFLLLLSLSLSISFSLSLSLFVFVSSLNIYRMLPRQEIGGCQAVLRSSVSVTLLSKEKRDADHDLLKQRTGEPSCRPCWTWPRRQWQRKQQRQ